MKSFIQFLSEQQEPAGFVRHYALTQKERHTKEQQKIEGHIKQIVGILNVGLQQDDLRAKVDQLILAMFYFAQMVRFQGEMSAATLNSALTNFLSPNHINANLEKYPQPEEPSFSNEKPAIKKNKT
jgi:hypothetical protein